MSSAESFIVVGLIFVVATGLAALAVTGAFLAYERWSERWRERRRRRR
jgi:hypothetical protein